MTPPVEQETGIMYPPTWGLGLGFASLVPCLSNALGVVRDIQTPTDNWFMVISFQVELKFARTDSNF